MYITISNIINQLIKGSQNGQKQSLLRLEVLTSKDLGRPLYKKALSDTIQEK